MNLPIWWLNRAVAAIGLASVLYGASPVVAHPMGNFSINHYTHIEAQPHQLEMNYVLDLAEIPTVSERELIDSNNDNQISENEKNSYLTQKSNELCSNLSLVIAGEKVTPKIKATTLGFRAGAGGLDTLRISMELQARLPAAVAQGSTEIVYTDNNYPARTGWKEITATSTPGIVLLKSSVPKVSASKALTTYPTGVENVAPQQLTATLRLSAATGTVVTQAGGPSPVTHTSTTASTLPPQRASRGGSTSDAFTRAIAEKELTPALMLGGLLIAFLFGMVHALAPGHGKTMVAAYLVGSRGTPRHAALLGLVVTVTHTFGVFALGFLTLFAANYIVPEKLYPVLSTVSGLMIFCVGIWLLSQRTAGMSGHSHDHDHHHDDSGAPHSHDGHESHSHGDGSHTHSHGGRTHTHSHTIDGPVTLKTLVTLGISGGIVPCPEALVVLLAAIKLHRIAYGMFLITAFSIGLASALIAIGLMVVMARRRLGHLETSTNTGLWRFMPIGSAAAITVIGLLLVIKSMGIAGS